MNFPVEEFPIFESEKLAWDLRRRASTSRDYERSFELWHSPGPSNYAKSGIQLAKASFDKWHGHKAARLLRIVEEEMFSW